MAAGAASSRCVPALLGDCGALGTPAPLATLGLRMSSPCEVSFGTCVSVHCHLINHILNSAFEISFGLWCDELVKKSFLKFKIRHSGGWTDGLEVQHSYRGLEFGALHPSQYPVR